MNLTYRSRALKVALALSLAGPVPAFLPSTVHAQATAQDTDLRLKRIEAELRAVQRKVFPDGAGKTFTPEIGAPAPGTTAPTPAANSAVTDLMARMDAVESQLKALTGQAEESQNRLAKLEARLTALEPAPAPAPATEEPAGPSATPIATTGPSATAPVPASKPAATKPAPAATTPAAAKPAEPSAARVAAVAAIEKPVSDDKGEDLYSYGYRLWEAKFFPEAQQALTAFTQQFPKHKRLTYARNLLGRAYLDDNKPGTAAQWFVQNYLNDKQGERAPDSLLYLGVAMTRLKETKRACTAFAEFKSSYPAEAAGRLKAQYDAASKSVTCN
jgi:TolA-binding protein